jgi:hypothetical protein
MKIKFKKPSSIAGLITAIVLAVLLILFVGAYSKREAFSSFDLFGGKEAVIESQNKDTDNDGLKDWQEDLFGTDPTNPDTDKDGFLDGEEISSNHNPLVKSPGDTQIFYPLPLGDKYNVTKKVLSDENLDTLFASYFSQKNQYLDSNPQIDSQETFSANVNKSTISEMWKRALGDLYSVLTEKAITELETIPGVFDITVIDNDINISQDNSKEAIQTYIDQVSAILYASNFFLKEEASTAITKAFEEDDFSQLDTLIKENDARIEQAKEIPAPSTWKDIHKKGLELTLLVRNIYVALRDVYDDPLKAYIASNKLEEFPLTWNNLMGQAIDLASSQGITISLQK